MICSLSYCKINWSYWWSRVGASWTLKRMRIGIGGIGIVLVRMSTIKDHNARIAGGRRSGRSARATIKVFSSAGRLRGMEKEITILLDKRRFPSAGGVTADCNIDRAVSTRIVPEEGIVHLILGRPDRAQTRRGATASSTSLVVPCFLFHEGEIRKRTGYTAKCVIVDQQRSATDGQGAPKLVAIIELYSVVVKLMERMSTLTVDVG